MASAEIFIPSAQEKTSVACGKRSSASLAASAQRGVSFSLRVALYISSSAASAADPAAGGGGSSATVSGSWSGCR